MKKLEGNRVYSLRGVERPVYAVRVGGGEYFLYDCEFGVRLPPRFKVLADGRIKDWHDDVSRWTVDDLIDTGRKIS